MMAIICIAFRPGPRWGVFFCGGIGCGALIHFSPPADAISLRMSSTRHAVVDGPSLTGWGKRPDLTPAHHADLQTGITGGIGGTALGLPMILERRRKPVSGSWFILDCSRQSKATGGRRVHPRFFGSSFESPVLAQASQCLHRLNRVRCSSKGFSRSRK